MNQKLIKAVKDAANNVQVLNNIGDKFARDKNIKSLDSKQNKKTEIYDIKTYIWNSINTYSNLIEFQAASKLASKSLLLDGAKNKTRKAFYKWTKLHSFDLLHFSLERRLTGDGVFAIVLRKYSKNKVQPALARITTERDHASNTTYNIVFQVEKTSINGKEYSLQETHNYDTDKKLWNIKRSYVTNKDTVPIDGIAFNLQAEETSKEPLFFVFENNAERKGDYANALLKMIDHGKFMYWLYKKFGYLSPKVFNKTSISGKRKANFEKQMEEDTLIDIESRAGQFQAPITVFNPTLPNAAIMDTLKFLEDQIFMSSLSSRLTDGGKQAQQNDLEQALKNEMSNNYIEFKRKLREKQFTEFFNMIAKIEGWDFTDVIVRIDLSSTQTRLLEGDKK